MLNRGSFLKERICSTRSKFLSLRVEPILKGLLSPWKQTRSHKSCFPLYNYPRKGEVCPFTLTEIPVITMQILIRLLLRLIRFQETYIHST